MYLVEVQATTDVMNTLTDLAWDMRAVEIRLLSRVNDTSRVLITFNTAAPGRRYEAAAEITKPGSIVTHVNTKEPV